MAPFYLDDILSRENVTKPAIKVKKMSSVQSMHLVNTFVLGELRRQSISST